VIDNEGVFLSAQAAESLSPSELFDRLDVTLERLIREAPPTAELVASARARLRSKAAKRFAAVWRPAGVAQDRRVSVGTPMRPVVPGSRVEACWVSTF
jgi:hypothetical protein